MGGVHEDVCIQDMVTIPSCIEYHCLDIHMHCSSSLPPPPPRWHSKHSADTRGPATATHHTYRYLCRYRAVPGYSQTGPHPRGPLLPPPPGNHGHREGGGGMASRGKSGCPDRAVHTPPLSVGRMSEGHLHHSHLHTYHPHCSHTHLHSHLHTHHLHHAHGCSIASGRRLSCSL